MARSKRMKMEVVENGRPVPRELQRSVVLQASERFRANQAARFQNRVNRLPSIPERRSIAYAMLMVEVRLVKAFWTIARQPLGMVVPLDARRNGIDYLHDRADTHARYTDAPGGKWDVAAPRPSVPSSKDIDAANEALDWLLLLSDEGLRKVLVIGATSKRGDVGRRIPWIRLRPSLPHYRESTVRTMQRHYQSALRIIVTELTIARMSSLSHKCAWN